MVTQTLAFGGLNAVVSATRFFLTCCREAPEEASELKVENDLERSIDYLKQALQGLHNEEKWEKEGTFFLTSEYSDQVNAYRLLKSAVTPTESKLCQHIETLEAVKMGKPVELDKLSEAENLFKSIHDKLRDILAQAADSDFPWGKL